MAARGGSLAPSDVRGYGTGLDHDLIALERRGIRRLLRVAIHGRRGAGTHIDQDGRGGNFDAARERRRASRGRGGHFGRRGCCSRGHWSGLGGRRRLGRVDASGAPNCEECEHEGEDQQAGVPHVHITSVGPGVFPIVTTGA